MSAHGEFVMKKTMRTEKSNPNLAEKQVDCKQVITGTIPVLMLLE